MINLSYYLKNCEMRNKPHLKFYMDYIEDGKIPTDGLCRCAKYNLISADLLEYLEPTPQDLIRLSKQNRPTCYWGEETYTSEFGPFTPLRQNIVLLMAAMNNEL